MFAQKLREFHKREEVKREIHLPASFPSTAAERERE